MGGGTSEARVQQLINATDLSALQGMVTDAQIPDAIFRDAELTAAAVQTLLGLTATEVNDHLHWRKHHGPGSHVYAERWHDCHNHDPGWHGRHG